MEAAGDQMAENKEIGSFLELQFPSGKEFYRGEETARLNMARAGILHGLKVLGCNKILLPYYQCQTVKDFLLQEGISVSFYAMDPQFHPILEQPLPGDCAILIVNYFGIMSEQRMRRLAGQYQNVILDNAQAFFAKPVMGSMNVYSPRKFFGVADGAYVIGAHAADGIRQYGKDFSSDTALFLLQRIEYGCEGKAYANRSKNEERLDHSGVLQMSDLTHTILDGIDYEAALRKRRKNFAEAAKLLDDRNLLDVWRYYDKDCVPMVYPFVVKEEHLLQQLQRHKLFQGRWWAYLLDLVPADSFEFFLSNYMIPITIDQRYDAEDIQEMGRLICEYFS